MNRYETYKEIDIPWLKKVPKHWEVNKVKTYGVVKKELNKNNVEKNVLSLTYGGVIKNDINNPNGLVPASYETYQKFCRNDLVFKLIDLENIKTSRVGIVPEDGIMSSAYIRLKLNDNFISRYGYYYFYKLYIEEVYNNLGAGVRSTMSGSDLKNMEICIPPLNEQEKIVNYLDWKINEIDKLISIEKKKIKLLQIYREETVFHNILKNKSIIPEEFKLEGVRKYATFIRGAASFTKDDLLNSGDYVALQYGKVYKVDIVNEDYNFYVNHEFYKASQVVNKGDILAVYTSETIDDLGHFAFYEKEEKGLIGGEQILIKVLETINPKYLFYALKSRSIELKRSATGIKVYRFKINDLKAIKIPVPSLKVQEKIVQEIENSLMLITERLKNSELKINGLEALKQSLIAEVVTGQIDVRNVVIPAYEKVDSVVDEEIEGEELLEDGD
jgi:restriction modification system DNA specificity domain protein